VSIKIVIAMKKTKRGRPRTGLRPFAGARFSKETLNAIDRYAKTHKVGRSEAIRRLVEKALDRKEADE
jgi:hypothetical protein